MMSFTILFISILLLPKAVTAASFSLSDRPMLKYGTAWKKEATADLVYRALLNGFRHIDTACQPRHYNEAGVGEGWTKAAKTLDLKREDIWLQTKFSSLDAQDPDNTPYDRNAPIEDRVHQSLQISLQNLKTEYIDSWVMHGPENSWEDNFKVWGAMEEGFDQGKVKQLGISNWYRLEDIQYLYDHARIKPKVVQNRFYSDSGHDVEIRRFCKENDIEYQSFWTLGANREAYKHQAAVGLADKYNLSPEGLFYAFCMAIGITPLDGTTNEQHMKEDIDLLNRLRNGEVFFENDDELAIVGDALGTPGWRADVDLEEEL